jgi:quercetin dioxygenase-like cupin family protein
VVPVSSIAKDICHISEGAFGATPEQPDFSAALKQAADRFRTGRISASPGLHSAQAGKINRPRLTCPLPRRANEHLTLYLPSRKESNMTIAAPAGSSHGKNSLVRKRALLVVMATLALFATTPAFAQNAPTAPAPDKAATAKSGGYPAVPLLETGKTIVGETIFYPKGKAHVTAAIFTLEPGGKSMVHKHGVPLFAYILEGELTVDYGRHGKRVYKQGDSLMEAMNVAHFSTNTTTQPVRLLAVYMGSSRAKDVIPVK